MHTLSRNIHGVILSIDSSKKTVVDVDVRHSEEVG
jgi:hypothetical protein